jgi:uncharacterized protein (DUF305 family)
MKQCTWQFAILMILVSAAATSASRQGAQPHSDATKVSPAWPALMASMEKMNGDMMSGGSSGDNDVDFVLVMLPHHQAAIDMAKTEILYGKDPQTRRLAQEVVTDQQSEVELMHLWLKQHATAPRKSAPMSQPDKNKER